MAEPPIAGTRVVLNAPMGKLTIVGGKKGSYEVIPNGCEGTVMESGLVQFKAAVGPVVVSPAWLRDAGAEDEAASALRTAPDLSHLPLDVQLRIEVAETQGATWERRGEGTYGARWTLSQNGRRVMSVYDDGRADIGDLADPLTDPAAWGALMERENIDVRHHADGRVSARTADRFLDGKELVWMRPWCYSRSLPRAVCLAVLAKHGRDTSRYMEEANG